MWAREIASNKTRCGSHTVTRTRMNTWRLRSVGWIRGLNLRKTGMDYLPLEVLNKIAKNRTLYVLAASLTVSVGWRGCFNGNWMWWQHCNSDNAEYLETA
ncbi:hypothetical protein J6590_052667 [Homalodisca vitripennis]|nr:hypothetical protein J6590_099222 [Homalodisca vitripennis]KAG8306230.1 hypothetical protein J6590_052667 [Homalodisca vitripennis]